jgi:SNF2 family DNA or RNA helicase
MQVDVPAKLQRYMDQLWDEWEELLGADRMEDRELPPFEEFSKLRAQLAESRIPVLLEVAEEHEETDTPLVVFSSHLKPLNALAERDGWEKITGDTPPRKRQEIVRRFQAGELKGVAASIRAAGIGLTLTRAWKMLFVDMDWVPGMNSQAEDRICRIGQTSHKVEIVRMVSGHTLDQHILDLIAWKIGIINAAINDRLTVNIERDDSEGETDEQFQQRMAEAAAVAAGLEADELAEVTSNEWPELEADPDLPF